MTSVSEQKLTLHPLMHSFSFRKDTTRCGGDSERAVVCSMRCKLSVEEQESSHIDAKLQLNHCDWGARQWGNQGDLSPMAGLRDNFKTGAEMAQALSDAEKTKPSRSIHIGVDFGDVESNPVVFNLYL